MSAISKLLVVPVLLATVGFSTAQARENHCDHSKGKARGTIIGGVLGAVGGAILAGKGDDAKGAIIGGVAGAVGGRVIGDADDDRRDREECGEDAESVRRAEDRQDERDFRDDQREARRDAEIDADIEASRARRDGRYGRDDRFGYPPPPMRRLRFQCQEIGRGRFGLVHLRSNQIVENWGRDLYDCKRSERRHNM